MATDICDKNLKALRNQRWNKAFDTTTAKPEGPLSLNSNAAKEDNLLVDDGDDLEHIHRKATIVIERKSLSSCIVIMYPQ